jgi:hypothetical protein
VIIPIIPTIPTAARLLLLAGLIAATAGCASIRALRTGGGPADALPFRAQISRGDGRDFSVSVANRGAGVDAVRESVRFEATRYCLRRFGGSDAVWRLGAGGDWLPAVEGERLRFAGRCTGY